MSAPTLTPGSEQVPEPDPPTRAEAVRAWVGGMGAAVRQAPRRIRQVSPSQLGRSPWSVGPLAALWAAGLGLAVAALPMLIVWIANPASGLAWLESLRIGGLVWVVAQGTPVAIGPVTYSLLPWGLVVIPALLLGYAGGWAARRCAAATVREVAVIVGSAAAVYGLVVGIVSSVTAGPTSFTPTWDAVMHGVVLAVLCLGFGAVRGSALSPASLVPAVPLLVLRGGVAATLAMLGAGAVALGAALTVRVDDAITMAQALQAGAWGGLGLLIAGLAFVPTMIVWASAYVLGAGFTIGPSVIVSPFVAVTAPTTLPPFPLLAAIPQAASPLAWALPVVGVLAGVIAGLIVSRHGRSEARLVRLAIAVGAAAVSGVLMLVLAYLATGAMGDIRLAHLGPSPATVGVLAFILVTIGAVPSALVGRAPAKPQLAVADEGEPAEAPVTDVPVTEEAVDSE